MPDDRPHLLRDRAARDQSRVTFVELFFDLVFVFAITQLSHALLEHLTPGGAAETALLLLAVWCAWIYTTWATSWLDAGRAPVRLMILALMAAGLVMAAALPRAFGDRGLVFAIAYALLQNGRNAFLLWALAPHDPGSFRNFTRIQVWLLIGGALWIAGGCVDGNARWALWIAALFAELGSPWWLFWTPGLGRSSTADWRVSPHHMAERCGLFVIIALGESILVMGATFAAHAWSAEIVATFALAFIGSLAMWWVYFATAADDASEAFAQSVDLGGQARAAYTYAHLPLVAGIIVTAGADELVLAHPAGHASAPMLAALLAGPALFLCGSALFGRCICGRFPRSHGVGLLLLAAALPLAASTPPLGLAALTVLALVVVGIWETRRSTARRHRS